MPRLTQAEYEAYLAREAARAGAVADFACEGGVECESDLHAGIMNECRRRGWLWIHARMDKASHLTIGCPDFLILADNGQMFMVECKTRTGKLSQEQLAFKAWAEKLNHKVYVVRSLSEFMTLINV